MRPPRLAPMLASGGPVTGSADEWAFEPKLDGWRAVVTVDAEGVSVRTRSGREIGDALPELAPLAGVLDHRSVILDGELVARDGRPWSFYRLGARMAARRPEAPSRRTPVAFAAFDLLWLDEDVCSRPYRERRVLLEELALRGRAWCTLPSTSDGTTLFAECWRRGLEGVMAKRLASSYRPGERSQDWVKVKTAEWRSVHGDRRHSA